MGFSWNRMNWNQDPKRMSLFPRDPITRIEVRRFLMGLLGLIILGVVAAASMALLQEIFYGTVILGG